MSIDLSQLDFSIITDHFEIVLTVVWFLLFNTVRRYTERVIRSQESLEQDKNHPSNCGTERVSATR